MIKFLWDLRIIEWFSNKFMPSAALGGKLLWGDKKWDPEQVELRNFFLKACTVGGLIIYFITLFL